ncbi:hypothetical protein RhiirA5_437946 [Rhizophagus irregularis]|uniref:Uncharacterized protein n=1 Tax=Rhizophagus irregularis TaxID=588596 RepID=A0A2N0NJV2_9GLOM|nr:hypothetical protein RhiirA5_437946 [Rhizophagus irregularis]PKC53544.1 hypothetical protein RhiirA1_479091 [Rhizophagus irregularis]
MSLNNNIISKEDENFLKEFLKDFYRQVIRIEYFLKYEHILKEWLKDYFNDNKKNPEIILNLMKNHEESENWFSSLIGFFYDHNIGHNNTNFIDIDKNYSLKLYLLSINNKDGINSIYYFR